MNQIEAESSCLSGEFLEDYKRLVSDFDELARDSFQGEKLERLAMEFIGKHSNYMSQFPFTQSNSKFPNCADQEALEEEWLMMSNERELNSDPEYAKLFADVYRRACQGCYLRITFNKSRRKQEDDRREAVQLGRFALRYHPNFAACYWFMIALGWQLDTMRNPKDRASAARTFHQTALHCIWLDPTDPLAHSLLGRYYYRVAGLSWLERTISRNLLGHKVEGSYEDSEREFMEAHALKDDWLPTGLWLARVLLAQRRPIEEVKRWIDHSLRLEVEEPSTEIEREELLELRAKLKLDEGCQ